VKAPRLLLFAVLVLAACNGSNSSAPTNDASDSTFVAEGAVAQPAGTPAVTPAEKPGPDQQIVTGTVDPSTLAPPVITPPLEDKSPPQTVTELPVPGPVALPEPLPEVGLQFAVSPTDIAYPKLATLYPGHLGPVVEDGMILPWLSKREPLGSSVKVQTALDTDSDGKPDRIALRIVQPAEVAEGLKTPVVVRPSIYYEDPEYAVSSRGPFLGEDQYIRMGFTVVYADSLGSNQSDGCPSIMDGTERQAMADVVRWLTQDSKVSGINEKGAAVVASWSTGHVAMEGVSYGGTLPTMAAATGVPGLEAIVPVDGISNAYDYFRRYNGVDPNGVVDLSGYARDYGTSTRKSSCEANVAKLSSGVDDVTLAYNAFWKERNTLALADNIKAATLIAHGQSDNNVKTKNSVQLYEKLHRLKKPVQLWFHSRDHDDPAWQKEWQKQILLWYTRYLFGVNNGVEKQSTYVRETPTGSLIAGDLIPPKKGDTSNTLIAHCGSGHSPRDCIPTGELLVKEAAWPKTDVVSYYLRLNAADLLLTPNAAEGTAPMPPVFNKNSNSGVFQTPPLANATRFAGTIKVAMTASFAGVANLKATLLVDGAEVTWGWANPRFYKGLEKEATITRGASYGISLEMMPRDFTVMPGSKISM
jgi:X-Pro dipeptidyl-peptidase